MADTPIKISVIIPVYSVENYISQCIDSVLGQTYTNLEVILVDDGSPDKSPGICDAYAGKDSRVKVIHKANGGTSDARNAGISCAAGDYILFLDGDDFWDSPEALERLVERILITRADVLVYSYKKYYEESGKAEPYRRHAQSMPLEYKDRGQQAAFLAEHNLYIASACDKMIHRSLFAHPLLFDRESLCEDIEWCARLLKYAESFDFINGGFYCYRQHGGSKTHLPGDRKCRDLCGAVIRSIELGASVEENMKTPFYTYAAYQYGTFIATQAKALSRQWECIERLAPYQWILDYHSGGKMRCVFIAGRILGFRNFCRIVRFLYQKARKAQEDQ